MPRLAKPVSEKSTKQDILAAYQELLEETDGQPITQSTITTTEKYDKAILSDLADAAGKLQTLIGASLDELRTKFSAAEKGLGTLYQMQEARKKALAEEHQEQIKEQTRQKEEFAYEFAKMKKRSEEELGELRVKTEAELSQKRQQIKEQEEEFTDLKNQVKTFEPRLQKSINDAVAQTTKDLTVAFDHERALLTQEAKMTQSLLEQKVGLLETTIATQKEEIVRLSATATQASIQMTRIAERAVTKTQDQPMPQPKSTA